MESLIEGIGKTYEDLDRINTEIQSSISSLEKTRVYRSKKWIVMVTAAFSAFLIIFGSSISFAILTLKKMNNLIRLNIIGIRRSPYKLLINLQHRAGDSKLSAIIDRDTDSTLAIITGSEHFRL